MLLAPTNVIDAAPRARIGLPLRLPLHFPDWTGIFAHFAASAAGLRALLPGCDYAPALIAPGTAVLTVAAIDYRRIDGLAPYREVAILTPVLRRGAFNLPGLPFLAPDLFESFGYFLLHAPKTTLEACEAGRTLFGCEGALSGCEKALAAVDVAEIANMRRCRLRADGADILTLDVEQVPAKFQRRDYRLYAAAEGGVRSYRVATEGLYGFWGFSGGARLTLGEHPLARELKALGLGQTAIARVFASNMESLVYAGDG